MAVAFDASSSGIGSNSSSATFSHTCTGSNLYLIVVIATTGTVSSVTYGSQTMTQLITNSAFNTKAVFGLSNPTVGTSTITVNTSASAFTSACSASYTGVDYTSPITSNATTWAGTSASQTLTISRKDAWIVTGLMVSDSGGSTVPVVSGYTSRVTTNSSGNMCGLSDSNGVVYQGDKTLSITSSNNNDGSLAVAIISGTAIGSVPTNNLLVSTI